MKKKKICLVVPSLAMGGMERVMANLAAYFYEHKNAEIALVLLAKRERFYVLPEGIKIHEPAFGYQKHSWLVQSFKTIKYLRNTIKNIRPDTVLSFCERYNSLVILSLLFLNQKIFVSDRASPLASSGRYVDMLNKYFYRLTTGIIAQTQIAKEILHSRNSHKNICVIGNPIKFINRSPDIQRENIILNVGRFADEKNQDLLLKYYKEINDTSWKIVFVGDGYKMENVIKLSKELNLSDHVEFANKTDNISEYYSKAKIFAFTSTTEGFPNALGEALSTPLACISFDCVAGPKDLIKDNVNGYLVNVNDHKDYIFKLKNLMQSESLRTKFEEEALLKIQKNDIRTIGNLFYDFITN